MEDVTVHQSTGSSALFNSSETASSPDIVLVKISSIHNEVIILMFLKHFMQMIVVQARCEVGREDGGSDHDEVSALGPADTGALSGHVQGRLSGACQYKGKCEVEEGGI